MQEKEFDLNKAYEYYLEEQNKTEAVRRLCADLGIEYSEKYRNRLQRAINSGKLGEEVVENNDIKEVVNPAKILIFDIETSPLLANVWGVWQQNIGHNLDMLHSDWFMLTWSAKWLGEDKIYSAKITPEEVVVEDDKRIVKSLWSLIDEADIIIAHNAIKFDVKRMNTRFLTHGLPKPSPYKIIDTLQAVKKEFSISSNKLDYLGTFLKLGEKMDTGGFKLWKGVMQGEQESIDKMSAYNDQDVILLEKVYMKMRGWIKHPSNVNMYMINEDGKHKCGTCGSDDLEWGKTNPYYTSVNAYETCRCGNCGTISRGRKTIITKETRDNLVVAI